MVSEQQGVWKKKRLDPGRGKKEKRKKEEKVLTPEEEACLKKCAPFSLPPSFKRRSRRADAAVVRVACVRSDHECEHGTPEWVMDVVLLGILQQPLFPDPSERVGRRVATTRPPTTTTAGVCGGDGRRTPRRPLELAPRARGRGHPAPTARGHAQGHVPDHGGALRRHRRGGRRRGRWAVSGSAARPPGACICVGGNIEKSCMACCG